MTFATAITSAIATQVDPASQPTQPSTLPGDAPPKSFNRHAHKRLRNRQDHSGRRKPSPKSTPDTHSPANIPIPVMHTPDVAPHQTLPATRPQGPHAPSPADLAPNSTAHSPVNTGHHAAPTYTPTPATVFTDSLLFHLTNLANIEARQNANPDLPLSQSHHRSLSRAFRFARHWTAAIGLPQFSGGITDRAPDSLPQTYPDAKRWLISLARKIFIICDRHMAAAHDLLKNDPTRTATTTDLNFDSLLSRVSSLDGLFTIDQQTTETQAKPPADSCQHMPTPQFATPSDSAVTQGTSGTIAQPGPNSRQLGHSCQEAARKHPDLSAISAGHIDNLIALFEAGETEARVLKPTRP